MTPLFLCWCYAEEPLRVISGNKYLATNTGNEGWLNNLGFFDRSGAIPILFAGGVASLVACIVVGPRYGVFMPIED